MRLLGHLLSFFVKKLREHFMNHLFCLFLISLKKTHQLEFVYVTYELENMANTREEHKEERPATLLEVAEEVGAELQWPY